MELTRELIEKNRELLEMDRLKNVFLQNISHEIRTPLNAIIGFSGILPNYFGNLEQLTEFTKIIHNRGYDLLEIMNNLMEVSLLEVNQVKIKNAPFDLIKFIDDLNKYCKAYQLKHDKNAITFNTKHAIKPGNETIITDGEKLSNIVYKLIDNAFKYTNSGEIETMLALTGNELLIKITDSGIGIPIQKHEKIFERFEQANDEDINDGMGLGLSIVKGYINLLGGKIELTSVPGKGSVFSLFIPINQPNK
jgi:signal transduction histidine kinase